MNYNNPNFASMSVAERRTYISQAMDEMANGGMHMMMSNADGSIVDINTLVQTVGREKVEDMLVQVLGKSTSASAMLTPEQISAMARKSENGELDEKAKTMVDTMVNAIKASGQEDILNASDSITSPTIVHGLMEILHMLKKFKNVDATYVDCITSLSIMMTGSMCLNPKNSMYNFREGGPTVTLRPIHELASEIEDIFDKTWNGKKPPADMFALALLGYAAKVADKMPADQKKFSPSRDICDFFGIDFDENLDCDGDC